MINIYDYETLGQKPSSAVILSCAAVCVDETRFSSDNPYEFQELLGMVKEIKLDAKEQIENYGRKVCKETLGWWAKQSKEARAVMEPNAELDQPLEALIPWMRSVFAPKSFVYTRGNTFDPMFTSSVCEITGVEEPYAWWSIRDIRSFIEGAVLQFNNNNFRNNFIPEHLNDQFIAHNALHDVAMDAYRMQFITRVAQGLYQKGAE